MKFRKLVKSYNGFKAGQIIRREDELYKVLARPSLYTRDWHNWCPKRSVYYDSDEKAKTLLFVEKISDKKRFWSEACYYSK